MAKKQEEATNTQYVIKGATLYWASLHEVNKYSEKYQVNATNLSSDDEAALTAMGINVRDGKEKGKPEMGMYIVAKANRPVTVVDAKRNTLSDATNVGNGSKGNVCVSAFPYDHPTGGKGVGCGLQAVQITELVEYSAAGMFEEVDGGYEKPAEATEASPF